MKKHSFFDATKYVINAFDCQQGKTFNEHGFVPSFIHKQLCDLLLSLYPIEKIEIEYIDNIYRRFGFNDNYRKAVIS
jgi:hypothetical protein